MKKFIKILSKINSMIWDVLFWSFAILMTPIALIYLYFDYSITNLKTKYDL